LRRRAGPSGDAAFRRARAARTALDYPAIFDALADGRLNLTAVLLLTPRLRPENAAELLAAAEHKTKFEIQMLLAERFPEPDLPARVRAVAEPGAHTRLAPAPVDVTTGEHLDGHAAMGLAPAPVGTAAPCGRVAPLSPGRFGLQVTLGQSAYDKLEYAKALLSHAVPSGDLAEVHERAYDALIAQLEKQKFAKASRRGPLRSSTGPRHIPARVKGTVWERDGGQCTFVAESEKRAQEAEEKDPDRSVVPWLRQLGCGLEDAREAAAFCATLPPDATMEERIRAALRFLGARRRRPASPSGTAPQAVLVH
jgi:hypothetical protein